MTERYSGKGDTVAMSKNAKWALNKLSGKVIKEKYWGPDREMDYRRITRMLAKADMVRILEKGANPGELYALGHSYRAFFIDERLGWCNTRRVLCLVKR